MQHSNEWFATAQDTTAGMVLVRVRLHIDSLRTQGRYPSRVEMQWQLQGDNDGMPTPTEAEAIDLIMGPACEALEKSDTAVLAAIYTGARQVRYMFYATTAQDLANHLQPLLGRYKGLPLRIGATHEPGWDEYIALVAQQAMNMGNSR